MPEIVRATECRNVVFISRSSRVCDTQHKSMTKTQVFFVYFQALYNYVIKKSAVVSAFGGVCQRIAR